MISAHFNSSYSFATKKTVLEKPQQLTNRNSQFNLLLQELNSTNDENLLSLAMKWANKLETTGNGSKRNQQKIMQIIDDYTKRAAGNFKLEQFLYDVGAMIDKNRSAPEKCLFPPLPDQSVDKQLQTTNSLIQPKSAQPAEANFDPKERPEPKLMRKPEEKNKIALYALSVYGKALQESGMLQVRKSEIQDEPNKIKCEYFIGKNNAKLNSNNLIAYQIVDKTQADNYPKLSPWKTTDDKDNGQNFDQLLKARVATLVAITRLNNPRYEYIPFGRTFDFDSQNGNSENENSNSVNFSPLKQISRLHTLLVRDINEKQPAIFAYIVGKYGKLEITVGSPFDSEGPSANSCKYFLGSANSSKKDEAYFQTVCEQIFNGEEESLDSLNLSLKRTNGNEYKLLVCNNENKLIVIPIENGHVRHIRLADSNDDKTELFNYYRKRANLGFEQALAVLQKMPISQIPQPEITEATGQKEEESKSA